MIPVLVGDRTRNKASDCKSCSSAPGAGLSGPHEMPQAHEAPGDSGVRGARKYTFHMKDACYLVRIPIELLL